MSPATYTERAEQVVTITSAEPQPDGTVVLGLNGDTQFVRVTKTEAAALTVGKDFTQETRKGIVTGWRGPKGGWISRRADATADDPTSPADTPAEPDTLQEREDALPDWIRDRIAHFHTTGGDHFAETGWACELAVAELAILYADARAVGASDSADIAAYPVTETRAHAVARYLADAHLAGEDLTGSISYLFPKTGDPDYSAGVTP